jgi:hypothetical protein
MEPPRVDKINIGIPVASIAYTCYTTLVPWSTPEQRRNENPGKEAVHALETLVGTGV